MKVKNNPHVPGFWKEFVPHHSLRLPSAEIQAQVTAELCLRLVWWEQL